MTTVEQSSDRCAECGTPTSEHPYSCATYLTRQHAEMARSDRRMADPMRPQSIETLRRGGVGDPMSWSTSHGDLVTVWEASPGDWRWHVQAANHEVVEQGEGHPRRITAVKAALRHHPRVEGQELTPGEVLASLDYAEAALAECQAVLRRIRDGEDDPRRLAGDLLEAHGEAAPRVAGPREFPRAPEPER